MGKPFRGNMPIENAEIYLGGDITKFDVSYDHDYAFAEYEVIEPNDEARSLDLAKRKLAAWKCQVIAVLSKMYEFDELREHWIGTQGIKDANNLLHQAPTLGLKFWVKFTKKREP